MAKIGIISGYGTTLNLKLENIKEEVYTTPYGNTSSPIISGAINDNQIFILKRHGINEDVPSFKVNFKANIYALYDLGCQYIFATSVCGSLQEEVCTGEFVVFDQFIDLTTYSELTFSDKLSLDKLNHSSFHKPFADEVRDSIIEASIINGFTTHTKGVVMAVDGPRQSTRSESNLYRKLGADVINTTTTPEAILSHELDIKYGALSLCTYFDTWRTDIPPSSRGEKMEIIELNASKVSSIIEHCVTNLKDDLIKS